MKVQNNFRKFNRIINTLFAETVSGKTALPERKRACIGWCGCFILIRIKTDSMGELLVGTLRAGVVGVGHLGRFHAQKYALLEETDLVGVFDADADRARAVAGETGCKPFDTLDALLSAVDVVSLAVPTDRHFRLGEEILKKGIHCLIEKPVTRTLEEADRLIGLAEKQGLVLQVGHIERYNPAFKALSDIALEPQFIESHRLAMFNPRGTEVSVILDLMIHDLDIVLKLMGQQVVSLDAKGVAVVSDTVDIANVRLHFEKGGVANLTASRISQKKMRKMRLFQKDAYIAVDFLAGKTDLFRLGDSPGPGEMSVSEIGVDEKKRQVIYRPVQGADEDALLREIGGFVHAVQGKASSGASAGEGRAALDLALQILNSMDRP